MDDDPRQPTHHPPGSPGKIQVLGERAAHGLPLFLEGDEVDCSASTKRRARTLSPLTLDRLAAVAEGRRVGTTYRELARRLGCTKSYIAALVKSQRRA